MKFSVRVCEPVDALALSLLARATILETYAGIAHVSDLIAYAGQEFNIERLRSELTSSRSRFWAVEIEVGRCLVGYAQILSSKDGDAFRTAELKRLYLLYRFHGLGLGKSLMEEVLKHARIHQTARITLRVNSANNAAIAFYRHFGFEVISEEPFRAGERDYRVLVMELELSEAPRPAS
jgi:ribosomal protein S18 acetylase RimI-like enzyme